MVMDNDPLYRLRHALAGMAVALLLSVPLAALLGRVLGDMIGGTGPEGYGARVAVYSALLLHVVVGAAVLFAKVARHETRPLTLPRVLLWLASLWTWPLLLLAARRRQAQPPGSSPDSPA